MSTTNPIGSAPARDGSPRTVPGSEQLVVDWTACDGRGMCIELLPELLEADPWGYPRARVAAPGGTLAVVPESLLPAARQAVNLCPLLALRLQPPAR